MSQPISPKEVFRIRVASAEEIRQMSVGEVTRGDRLEPRSQWPIARGLFCESLFGKENDWECSCGRLRGQDNVGYNCLRCEQAVVHQRSTRFAHVNLACPLVHPLFMTTLAAICDYTPPQFRRLVYFQDYVVLEPGASSYPVGGLLTEIEARPAFELGARFEMGADAVRALLSRLSLLSLLDQLRQQHSDAVKAPAKLAPAVLRHLRWRLRAVEGLCQAAPTDPDAYVRNMLLEALPVLPPEQRRATEQGGNLHSSGISFAYARIIDRNNRLRRLEELNAPEVIVRNEKRMLQQSVHALFDNASTLRPIEIRKGVWMRSLGDRLRGPTRRRLLIRRVDYSASGVLVADADVSRDTCAIPLTVAVELFRTTILGRLATGEHERRLLELLRPRLRGGLGESLRAALRLYRELLTSLGGLLQPVLEDVLSDERLVLSVHRDRPGPMIGLRPVLGQHRAVAVHPEVMTLLEATPGRTVRLHLPLSIQAKEEAATILSLAALRERKRAQNASAADPPPPSLRVEGVADWFRAAQADRRQRWTERQDRRNSRQAMRRSMYGRGLLAHLMLGNAVAALARYAETAEEEPADSFLARWVRGAIVEAEDPTP